VLNAQSLQIKKDEIQKRFALLLELYKSNIQELEVKDFQNNVIQGKKAVDAILSSFTIIFSSVKDFRKRGEKYSEDEKIADLSYAYEILYFGYHKQNIFRYLTESEWGEYSTNFSALPLHFIAEIQSSNDENKLFALYLYERFQNNAIDSANKSFDWLRSSHIHSFKGYHNDLGHYFRHAFNMVTYINEQKILTEEEQYDYVKLWRTQLTNNEQKLLFLNSFFKYGRDWEFAYRDYMESVDPLKSDHDYCLVTKYSLIKNLPNGEVFDGIIAGDFYPDIEFEND
ncbi:MAG: hypothetical protein JST76_15190, partial [Bacteroidetes bacterium]|nr:hypothetical protein [Bacteroidota bacterium]